MLMGRVTGSIWATVKHAPLASARFVLVQPLNEEKQPCGDVFAALDTAASGPGDLVIYTTAYEAVLPWKELHPAVDLAAVDACVVGVIDRVDAGARS
jgi:ethanolamine utilization protein EutN